MKNVAVLDSIFGDTGKGRISHWLSPKADWIVRQAGSNNCGHVLYRDGKKYTHHFLPSVDYRNNKTKSFLASGMFLHLETLFEEIVLASKDFPDAPKSIYIDPEASIITDEDIKLDKEQNAHLGTTGKGVSFAAAGKYGRTSSRVHNHIKDNSEIIKKLKDIGVNFSYLLSLREIFEKSSIVFEGHQGVMLDINAGITPFITSSDCTVSGIYSSGFNFIKLDRIYGLSKGGYATKSGNGPLPTEMPHEEACKLRKLGNEIGNSTGRDRRIAYMDLPMLKYGIQRGGITHLILTKLDILNGQEKIKVCYDYGKPVYSGSDFEDATPHYIDLPGWQDARDIEQIKPFLKHVRDFTNTPIEYVSVGVNDEDMIKIDDPYLNGTDQNAQESVKIEQSGFIKFGDMANDFIKNIIKDRFGKSTHE